MSDTPRTDKNSGFDVEALYVTCADFSRQLERELNAANARITTLQTQLDQRWEMMRGLEEECGTKDVEEAVKYIKGLKARVVELEKTGEALNNAIWSVQDWGGTYVGDCSSEWEKVKGAHGLFDSLTEEPVNVEGEMP